MSDAAPAKVQKTERSDTPHHGRPGAKPKGQNKRPQHNKVGCCQAAARHTPCFSAHLRGPGARHAQGNQNQNAAALARRSIDVCAQARATRTRLTLCRTFADLPPLSLAPQRGDIEGALALFRRAKTEVTWLWLRDFSCAL